MKKNILPFLLIILSVVIATFIWEHINLPYNLDKKILGDSYLENLHNPLNDTLRFLVFLIIPFLSLIIYFQVKEKVFYQNCKQIIYYKIQDDNYKDKKLEFVFYLFLLITFFEFFYLDFTKFSFEVDIFHEGLWLGASQNSKFQNEFWLSSYIGRGFFGNFHPFFLWKFLGLESIGSTRFLHVLIILFNKILLLLISKKISSIIDLKEELRPVYFLLLSLVLLSFTGYGDPVFFIRSFLLLLFIYISLKFLSEKKNKFIYSIIIGFSSSISMFWYIDIGIFINFLISIFLIFLILRFEFKYVFSTLTSIFVGWLLIYNLFPSDEINAYWKNNFLIISTLEYIHGLIYPTPFLSKDARSTRALLIFLFTGLMIIFLIKDINKKNLCFLISIMFLYLASIIFFRYGLSRSDSSHIRIAQGFLYIPFFSLVFYSIFKNKQFFKFFNNIKKIKLSIIFLLLLSLIISFLEKKYESKNILNVLKFKNSINNLVQIKDESYLSNDYKNFLKYYKNLIKNEKCVMVFTNEAALSYFLKKPTCSKYYLRYTSTPEIIQKELIEDIKEKTPNFIIYKSEIDIYHDSNKQRLYLVDNYIKRNYTPFEKYKHWEIYKIK